jgi:DNA-binding NtrC family response regulator
MTLSAVLFEHQFTAALAAAWSCSQFPDQNPKLVLVNSHEIKVALETLVSEGIQKIKLFDVNVYALKEDLFLQNLLNRHPLVQLEIWSSAHQNTGFHALKNVSEHSVDLEQIRTELLGDQEVAFFESCLFQKISSGQKSNEQILNWVLRLSKSLNNKSMLKVLLSEEEQFRAKYFKKLGYWDIVGSSAKIHNLQSKIKNYAQDPSESRILINGEKGTDKKQVARSIHFYSSRRTQNFVWANCSRFSKNRAELELFGYKKGAFFEATEDYAGLIAQAHLGVLFLDEIGSLSAEVQIQLDQFIKTGEYRALGSESVQHANVRLVFGTSQNLRDKVNLGEFDEEFYWNLSEINIHIPALNELIVNDQVEKSNDFETNVAVLLQEYCGSVGEHLILSESDFAELKSLNWTSNLLQLSAVLKQFHLEKAQVSLTEIYKMHEVKTVIQSEKKAETFIQYLGGLKSLEDVKRIYIQEILELNHFNKSKTARDLDIAPNTLKKYADDDFVD